MLTEKNLNKYNASTPRYTSYPPANFFAESFSESDYRLAIEASNTQHPEHISIYIHIPFCFHMCYYCGCNSVQMQGKDAVDSYMDALKKEIKIALPLLSKERKVSQIHYGGGSPSILPVRQIREINDLILSYFTCIEDPEIAIECHPGYLDEQYWRDLAKAGFNRISIGVQDFDQEVLKASNRKASRMDVAHILDILRAEGVSVNMDFIFGLPKQTVSSFAHTIEKAVAMGPDRLVTFSYAHVPWVNQLQLKLEEIGLPPSLEKEKMYSNASSILEESGYKAIGMDHFVLPKDELYIASESKSLHRNFQGYCTRRTTGQVYAFGVTGISQLAMAYSQNTKDIKEYIERTNRGELPVLRGYILNEQEQIAREVISNLMCSYNINWGNIATLFGVSVDEVKGAMNYDDRALQVFAADGIIHYDSDHISMPPHAKALVRNVAASLDKLMLNTDKHFSKTI